MNGFCQDHYRYVFVQNLGDHHKPEHTEIRQYQIYQLEKNAFLV